MEENLMLWQDFLEPVVIMEKKRVPDGEGGLITAWKEGAEFEAAVVLSNSTEAKIAQKMGVTGLYTVTTPTNAHLEYHDVFKRLSDGKIFRVTTDAEDMHTPSVASFSFWQVSAEEWELTT